MVFYLLNLFTEESLFSDADFESVVIRRIVRPGDHHSTIDVFREYGVIKNGSWDPSDYDRIASTPIEFRNQNILEYRRAFARIVANSDLFCSVSDEKRPERLADVRNNLWSELWSDLSPDVVFPENVLIKIHGSIVIPIRLREQFELSH